jgi:uncharacterized membrane-anchored protein
MKMKAKLGFILIVAFQVLILVGWTGYNEISLATGKEVVLQTVPVDPMDIFRGEYVQLRYQISTLANIPGTGTVHYGDKVYVHMEQDGEVWKATEVAKNKNADWEYFIAGEMESGFGGRVSITVSITYGIEAYFVPEGKGMAIQTARDIKVRVVINGSGQAFIKGLIVDGTPFQLN